MSLLLACLFKVVVVEYPGGRAGGWVRRQWLGTDVFCLFGGVAAATQLEPAASRPATAITEHTPAVDDDNISNFNLFFLVIT